MSIRVVRPLLFCFAIAVPAVVLRGSGIHPTPLLALLVFGGAVVAASFLLAWAAEAVQVDISGGLAIALLAFIAVLPEYAVDLYFAYTAGSKPEYVHYAAANLLGANQLVLGLGWPLVAIVGLRAIARRRGRKVRELVLSPRRRIELIFVGVAGVLGFVMPLSGQIHLALGLVLLVVFGFYLWHIARQPQTEPELIGTAARLAELPKPPRRTLLGVLFIFSALAVLASAEPFANALIDTGTKFGVNKVLLVQWLAPLASEAPEFIVAILLARRGNADDGLGALLSSKVNQWTLLVGSLPIAYLAGGGHVALPLDAHQVAETTLTAAQTMLGFAVLLRLRFHLRWALVLLGLFLLQFAVPGETARYVISAVYGVLAAGLLVRSQARVARRAVVTLAGVVLLAVGAVLLIAPGPGLIVVALGLLVLGTEYEWARRHATRTLHRARQAADQAAARPAALAGTAAFGAGLVGLGVVLTLVDGLPGSGVSSGASLVVSGAITLGTLAWAVRRRQSARR
ncbi:MAG TPA: PGPGW domain-containing protein [Mycobacteriales bacterium]|jgi:cation:H+ antiporter|nr:PGPGW domain-containing protein [Mycobacteriales bacterium]